MTGGAAPPNDPAAERALIGACLIDPTQIDLVGDVTTEDFYRPAHSYIWGAIQAVRSAGDPVDQLTVTNAYQANPVSPQPEGVSGYLVELALEVPSTRNAPSYAARLRNLTQKRKALALGLELAQRAKDMAVDADELLGWATQSLHALDATSSSVGAIHIADAIAAWAAEEQEWMTNGGHDADAIPTGLRDLDKLIIGLRAGQMVTIGARPGAGKTALALQIAANAASLGHPTLFVSAEMGVKELTQRLVAAGSHVPLAHIRGHNYSERDWALIQHTAGGPLGAAPLWFLDVGTPTLPTVASHARRIPGLRLIVVDYLQLLAPSPRRDNRQIEVSEIATGLKRMAREMAVPVIAAAQLNRTLEGRADKKPILADLRESGQIEQDSDIVIGIYRDEMYRDDSPDRGIAELCVIKHRNGPLGDIRVAYMASTTRFADLAVTSNPPGGKP